MYTEDYEISGTLTFSNDELKKDLHQIALNGLKAFVDAYETAYLGSTTLDNGIKISVEDNTRLPYATLGDSVTDAKDFYDLTEAMYDSYEVAKSLCGLETQQNINSVDLVSGITTSVSNVKKIADDMGDTLGFTSPKSGIISSVIGFAGAAIATFDGTTKAEKDALVQSGIDLVGEGLKLALKAIPGVGLLGSVGIDIGVDLAKILVENIYDILKNLDDTDNSDSSFAGKYREGLVSVDSVMDTTLEKYKIPKCTNGDDLIWNEISSISINALSGNDKITNEGSNVTIIGGSGNDEIVNWESGASIVAGTGKDSIFTYGSDNQGSEYFGGEWSTIYTGDGNDYIENICSNNYIDLGNDNDYISIIFNHNSLKGLNNTVVGGAGNDTIELLGNPNIDYIQNYYVNEKCMIKGSTGDDVISLNYYYPQKAIIQYSVGDGNDTIYGYHSYLHYGEIICNMMIQISNGEYETVANGNDLIIKVGNGSILIKGADNTTVNIQGTLASDNVPKIESEKNIANTDSNIFDSVSIYGGADNDYTSSNLTISGGDGTTTTIYDYTGGDKIIKNYSSEEKVKLSSDFAGIDISGNNFVIKSGSGSLTLENVRDKVIDVAGTDGNTAAYVYMFNGEGFIDGTIADKYEIIVGSENAMNHLKAGNFGSSLIGGGGYTTLTSGASDDFMQGGTSQDTFVYTGGNDVISNYQSGEQVNFAATYTGWTTDENNLVITAAEGSVRINDAQNKLIKVGDANGNLLAHIYQADGYEGIIDGRGFGAYEVIIGSDNFSNQIFADSTGSSLWGGRGNSNDELYGNTGADVFIYAYNNGQDNVFNAGLEDSVDLLNISLDQIASAQITDNGVTVQFTDGGSLNINGQAGSFKLGGQTFYADYHNKSWS